MANWSGGNTEIATSPFDEMLKKLEAQYAEAKSANELRYGQAMAIYDEIINRYGPGGTFGAAAEAQLGEQKQREVSGQMQQMISSGLYGTQTAGGLGAAWEKEVGSPARLKLEDIKMERLSAAQLGKAQFIENRQDTYPSYEAAIQAAAAKAQAGGGAGSWSGAGGGGGGGGGGGSGTSRFSIGGGFGDTLLTPYVQRGAGSDESYERGGEIGELVPGVSSGGKQIPVGSQGGGYYPGGTTATSFMGMDTYKKLMAKQAAASGNAPPADVYVGSRNLTKNPYYTSRTGGPSLYL